MNIHGIHHITAISSDAQSTYNFYTKILGLRLVKKSVNQDDVQTYHLFFGNKNGSPGMDLTFFPFANVAKGQRGNGLVTTISFAVPTGSLDFWIKRFKNLKIKHDEIRNEFGHKRLMFYDEDEQRLELVEVADISEEYKKDVWTTDEIKEENALHSFHSATLDVLNIETIQPVLDLFGYKLITKKLQNYLFKVPGKTGPAFLEVEEKPSIEPAINGYGTVHHIAFAVTDLQEQEEFRKKLIEIGEQPTHMIDRFYFASVYFRTKAGILFEIATEGPGFTADEEASKLGEKLALPPFLEEDRTIIEAHLKPLKI
jgi:glyoxalase family protein